jgi:cytidylate kinase
VNVITVSREYGAGGGEVARCLAEALGWQLLDQELLHRIAALEHLPDAELERLDEKAISLTERFLLHPPHQRYHHGLTEVVRQSAARGNAVLVGRGTRHLLGDLAGTFHLRLVAPLEWRARRMAQREGWSPEQALAQCRQVDQTRDRFLRYFHGAAANQPDRFDLVANSSRVPLADVAACLLDLIRGHRTVPADWSGAGRRVVTVASEMACGEAEFLPALAARLKLRLCQDDSQEMRLRELAAGGDVILAGGGGNRFLQDDPAAFHVRLTAAPGVRVRRVMQEHWLREDLARQRLAESDARRRHFHQSGWGADWSSPLEYHVTVNTGRLGLAAVDLVARLAERHWQPPTAS